MVKIKCSKIKYYPDEASGRKLKSAAVVEIPSEALEIISTEDTFEDALSELKDYLIDEISETADCPVMDLSWEII